MNKATGKVVGVWSDQKKKTVSMKTNLKRLVTVSQHHFSCLPEIGDKVDFEFSSYKRLPHQEKTDEIVDGKAVWKPVLDKNITPISFKVLGISGTGDNVPDYVEEEDDYEYSASSQQSDAGIPEEDVPFDEPEA